MRAVTAQNAVRSPTPPTTAPAKSAMDGTRERENEGNCERESESCNANSWPAAAWPLSKAFFSPLAALLSSFFLPHACRGCGSKSCCSSQSKAKPSDGGGSCSSASGSSSSSTAARMAVGDVVRPGW